MSQCQHHHHCIDAAVKMAETYCDSHGLRFTEMRRRIFELIWQSHKALTAHEIMKILGNSQPPITYRALEFLQKNHLIHHVASLNAFIGCQHVGEDHTGQLLVCTDCHLVKEIEQDVPHLKAAAKDEGFQISQMQVEVLGLCKDCQQHFKES